MSQLDNVIQVIITRGTRTISQSGFGVPMIFGIHAKFAEDIKSYTDIDAVLEDFTTSDPEYKKAAALFAQTPRPPLIKIGKRVANEKQKENVSVDSVATGTYTVTINGNNYNYEASGGEAQADIVDALITAINIGSEPVTLTDNGNDFDIEADVAGVGFTIAISSPSTNMTLTTSQANVNIITELAALRLFDDDWYCLISTSNADQDILQAAEYIETLDKVYAVLGIDTDIITSATDDIMSELKALNYNQSFLMYSSSADEQKEAAFAGRCLPENPGSITWNYKNLSGITTEALNDTEISNALGKNSNVYISISGIGVTREGKVASGEYIDVTRGIHWLKARIQERIFSILVNNNKIPYTNAGIDAVKSGVLEILRLGIARGVLAASPEPVVTAPDVSEVSSTDKANRYLPDVSFTATLAGAIHTVKINGLVQV